MAPLVSVLMGFDFNLYKSKFVCPVTCSLHSRRRHCLSFRITNNTRLSLRISIVFMLFNCTQLDWPVSHVDLGEVLILLGKVSIKLTADNFCTQDIAVFLALLC